MTRYTIDLTVPTTSDVELYAPETFPREVQYLKEARELQTRISRAGGHATITPKEV